MTPPPSCGPNALPWALATIKRLLLIDDADIDQRLYLRMIKRSKLVEEVHSFYYADEALDFLRQNRSLEVDVIFLDINMPRMNGFEFLEAANAEFGDAFASVVIVMLTTSLNPLDRERAEEFSVVRDFVNKPLTIEMVKHAAELLRKTRAGEA